MLAKSEVLIQHDSPARNKKQLSSPVIEYNDSVYMTPVNLSLSLTKNIYTTCDQILQLDGNQTSSNICSDTSSLDVSSLLDQSNNNSLDEIDNVPYPAVFGVSSDGSLEVIDSHELPDLPLIIGANFRSVGNKQHSLN